MKRRTQELVDRAEAMLAAGQAKATVARELGVSEMTLRRWLLGEVRGTGQDAFVTQEELARAFGVTRTRIQALEQRALQKLRRHPIMQQLARDYGLLEEQNPRGV